MKRKLLVFILRCLTYCAFRLRIYANWSRIHRLLFDRQARGTKLPTFKTTNEIVPFLRGMVWRSDSWIDLGDAVCSPEMVWWRYLNAADHKVGDCDEFAIFSANVIAKSIADQTWEGKQYDPHMMSVTWVTAEGHPSGHNVCLLKIGDEFRGYSYGYMDYGSPIICGTKQRVADTIRAAMAGPEHTPVCWGVHTPGLGFVEVRWGV